MVSIIWTKEHFGQKPTLKLYFFSPENSSSFFKKTLIEGICPREKNSTISVLQLLQFIPIIETDKILFEKILES